MLQPLHVAREFLVAEDGATMVEYGLVIALIAAVCITAITDIGSGINVRFGTVRVAIEGTGN